LDFLTEGKQGTANPRGTLGFFTEANGEKEGARQIQTSFPPPEFFTEGNEGNEGRSGPSKIQSLFSSLSFVRPLPMHPLYEKADKLSSEVIGAAIEVHRAKGPGLIESIYERCILRELELHSIPATTQKLVRVEYKGLIFDEPLRFDVLVDDCLLVELKAVEILHPSSKAQLFSYMKLLDIPIGLLINFHEPILKNGISRMILPRANQVEQDESNQISF
jgi:GxxExxY protein